MEGIMATSNMKNQRGFTLIELMIGLTIGLLLSVVIMQVLSVFENQKRATSSTADAQTNGSIALYSLSREMQQAGFPLMPVTNSAWECTTLTFGATGIGGLSPVSISDGVATAGVSASDQITIRYGDSQMGGVPTQITALGAPTANDATVNNVLGCQVGDIVMITNGATCAMTSVTALSAASATPQTVTLDNTTAAAAGANLACLGNWNEVTYRVNNGNLERNGVPTVAGIINLQAQYGVSDTANSNQVTQWVDASGGTWAAPTIADRNRIKAIRIAVVARNPKMEPAAVTAACNSTTAAAPTGLCAWPGSASSPAPTLDLGAGNTITDWSRFRYRVFETVVPLRNMIWARETL